MIQQTLAGSTEGANVRRRGNADVLLTFSSPKSVGLKSREALSLSAQLCYKACIQLKVCALVFPSEASQHTNHTSQVLHLTCFLRMKRFMFLFFQVSSRKVT